MFDRVMVAVGSRDEGRRAAGIGATVARLDRATFELVKVSSSGDDEAVAFELASLASQVREDVPGSPPAELTVLQGLRVAPTVADHVAAQDSTLVCLASTVHNRLDELLLGSTTAGVLRRLSSPALAVGPGHDPSTDPAAGPVVVCVDGSDHAASMVPLARDWVAATGQAVWVLSVIPPDEDLGSAHETVGVERVAAQFGTDANWEVVRDDDPSEAIAAFAASIGAGLIVLASHGRSALAELALGSVALGTLHHARSAVLVRRPTGVPHSADD